MAIISFFKKTLTISTSTSMPKSISNLETHHHHDMSSSSSPSKGIAFFTPPPHPLRLPSLSTSEFLDYSDFVPLQLPDYTVQRNQLFEELKIQRATALASKPRKSTLSSILQVTMQPSQYWRFRPLPGRPHRVNSSNMPLKRLPVKQLSPRLTVFCGTSAGH